MAENLRQEGSELLLQVGLSGRFVPLQGVTDSMTILEVKHRARDKVAKLLGKEFLSAELMSLLLGDGVDALKNEITLEDLRGTSGSALRIIVDSTSPPEIFGLALSDPKHFEGGMDSPLVKALLKWLGEGGAKPCHGKDEQQKMASRFMSLYFDVTTKGDSVKEQLPNHEDFKFDFGLLPSLFSGAGEFVKTLQPKSGAKQVPCNGIATLTLDDYCSRHRECRGQYGATEHPGNCTLSGISNSVRDEVRGTCTGWIKDSEQAKKLFKEIECLSTAEVLDFNQAIRMSTLLSSLVEELQKSEFVGGHYISLRPRYAPYSQSVRCNGRRLDCQAKQKLGEFVQIFEGIKELFGK